MKRFYSLLIVLIMFVSPALAAKSKATPTPAPIEIDAELVEPPEQILRLLDIIYTEWETVNGKDQGKKNKYTKWFNNYK